MGGGPSDAQNNAANSQAKLTAQEAAIAAGNQKIVADAYNKISPFATSRLNGGLPYFNYMTDSAGGASARAFAPARADALRRMAFYGGALPSGFKEASLRNIDEAQGANYDDNLGAVLGQNEAAKGEAARVLTGQQQVVNPAEYFSGAMQGNNSIMNAPLAKPGIGGLLGGVAAGAAQSIPF